VGGSDSTDGMLVFTLARRRVHIDDQGFDTKFTQGHGGWDTN
jgi:hypothetical protein